MRSIFKKTNLKLFQKLSLGLLIFTIPSNLFKIFFEYTSYVAGLRVDYLIPKIHISDFAIFLLLFLLLLSNKNRTFLRKTWNKIQRKNIWLTLLAILLIFQLTIQNQLISFLFIIRTIELGLISILLINQKNIIYSQVSITAIKITLMFQSFVAWFQYLYQKSLLNYYFLGETNLNSYSGIAKSNAFGIQKILPYGTTAHPNVLGGILAIFSLIILNSSFKELKYKKINILIFLLGASTVLLTQSLSAVLALLLGSIIILFKNKPSFSPTKIGKIFLITNIVVISIFAIFLTNSFKNITSISRRAYLNNAAINMTANNIFTGIGLQNFTTQVEKYSTNNEVVRFVQPAHNVLLLFLSETGLIGTAILITLLIPVFRKDKKINHPEFLIALIPIMALDHYLLTIQSGLILLFLTITLSTME